MFQIGDIQFLIRLERRPLNRGRIRLSVCIETSAKKYQIMGWNPGSTWIDEREGPSRCNSSEHDSYDLKIKYEAVEWRHLVDATVSEIIRDCSNKELINSTEASRWRELANATMSFVQHGTSDADARVDFIDLVESRREAIESLRLEHQQQEVRRQENIAAAAVLRETRQREYEFKEQFRKEAEVKSLELLYSRLSAEEREEAERHRKITIPLGDHKFVIPVHYGSVLQYDKDDLQIASYCIVYQDPTIPYGDVALMKYILLKSDPKTFFKIAIKSGCPAIRGRRR